MADVSDFPPLLQEALRTGKMPARTALSAATGKDPEELARLLGHDRAASQPDPEEQRFGDRYRQLVDAMTADWYADHLTAASGPSAEERDRIAENCRHQVHHERWLRRQRLDGQGEPDTP